MTTHLRTTERTRRAPTGKPGRWQCWYCAEQIAVGDAYREHAQIQDDAGFVEIREHVECGDAFLAADLDPDDQFTMPQPRGRFDP